ncbi:unnamed protein product [Cylindrotheca closterium]|uniref:TIGR00297 family protein n=1 Tax=Cylindrotheca closterium TaxID=2856 RepID=A0AAD2JJ37_9STRA|nr:unnamed protein product [Cylindrotheca closterium]
MKLSTLLIAYVALPATAFVSSRPRLHKTTLNPQRRRPHDGNAFDPIPASSLSKRRLSTSSIVETASFIGNSLLNSTGHVPFSQALTLNVFLFTTLRSKLLKVLTPQGMLHACALGSGLWATLGWKGWTLCVAYLFFGSAVTKVKFAEKEQRGIAEGRGGRRGPENVWGSAATGLMCAICAAQGDSFLGISSDLFILGFVASLATKLSDTFASEIGKAYGKTTFLITTLERVEPGTEGAISAEGTAASVVGGLLVSLYGWSIGLINIEAIPISVFAAFAATNVESVLGATLQGKKNLEWITNEVVNFINTLVGGVIAIAIGGTFLSI